MLTLTFVGKTQFYDDDEIIMSFEKIIESIKSSFTIRTFPLTLVLDLTIQIFVRLMKTLEQESEVHSKLYLKFPKNSSWHTKNNFKEALS